MSEERMVTVLVAVHAPDDEAAAVTVLGAQPQVTVARRCAELSELLAAAEAGAGTAAVVSGDLPGLDREAVARLRGAGLRVVAIEDPTAPAERLAGLGCDVVVAGGDAENLVAGVRGDAPEAAEPAVLAPDLGGRSGTIIAVWGPAGSPGRTTTAIELAAALAGIGAAAPRRSGLLRRHRPAPRPHGADTVLLADADTYASSVTSRLGLLDDAPGLAAAARAAGRGVLDVVTLARHSPVVLPGVRVLTGITRASRWPELPATSLDMVFQRCRELASWTVVDCGPVLEADELLMYDTRAPQRNGATLSALQAADIVVVVGGADPVGLQRLVRGLEDLRDVAVPVSAARLVVVNRLRDAAVGRRAESQVRDALARYAGVDDVHVVPDDPSGLDAALLAGRVLAECAPGSPARAAFVGLAGRVRELVPVAV
ncbi:CpaE family protein [Promicromonospora sp. NPDC057138]|uniref:AAA family ATPase n=1 Tax=Promicromonospora sp. NPDC057138 TaxID=3346031 RepID=UPI003645DCA5